MPYGKDPTEPPAQGGGYGKDPTAPPSGVAGHAERDIGVAHPAGTETTAHAFRRGLSEGFGDQPPGHEFIEKTGPLGRALAQPFQTALRGVNALVHGGQEALASTGRLGRDIAAMPEAFAGSPGLLTQAPRAALRSPKVEAGAAAKADKEILNEYTRAVKPSSGKQTTPQLERYQDRARGAIGSIVENKQNLTFTDSSGNLVVGELPKSLEQFGDAIDQTKQRVFQKYNDMATQAGQQGVSVPLNPIVGELQKIINDPVTSAFHPELVEYAKGRAKAFATLGGLSAADAQRAVQTLNATLKSFYRNPDYALAARANVDSMIANQLRSELDHAVEQAVGPGYQGLRNEYGALKAIEGDVVKRTQVVGRQEKGGGILGRIADVASADEVLRGLITLSPTAVARGAALKGWAQYVKWRRDPNRAITKLFEKAEEQQAPTRGPSISPLPGAQAAEIAIPAMLGAATVPYQNDQASRGLRPQP
jgi:hypothetical protein